MTIKRDIEGELDRWLVSKHRRPLLIRGARQVGKSFVVQEWGRKNFDNYLEINLEEQVSLRSIFTGDLTASRILENLELGSGVNLRQPNTLLFIDEIQCEPRALLALRYLYEQIPELAVVAAGSLIEFVFDEVGLPVGRIDQLHMKPVTFSEFLGAMKKEHLRAAITKNDLTRAIPDIAHRQLLDLLRTYFYVGGMPEAVATYVDERDLGAVSHVHGRILAGYEDDFQKYSGKSEWTALRTVFSRAPSVVGDPRVKYVRLDREIRSEKLKSALVLLTKSQVLSRVVSTYAASPPLKSAAEEKCFKIIFLDIGLLHHALGFDWRRISLDDDLTQIKSGAFAEQFVGQELAAHCTINESHDLYYWNRRVQGSDAEVDYVIEFAGGCAPVEVKSGKRGTLKSLLMYLEKFGPKNSFVLSQRNVEQLESTTLLPLYMASRLSI